MNIQDILKEIEKDAKENHIPILQKEGEDFLLSLLKEDESIRDVLEVGTAIGYSSIAMASVRWDMHIDTIEIDPKRIEKAKDYIGQANIEDRITIIEGDALKIDLDKIYDFILIDAAKSQYRKYIEHFYENSRVGTIFFFDNMSFHGMVEDDSLTHNRSTIQMMHKIKKFKETIKKDPRFEVEEKDIGDGLLILKRIQ